MWLQDLHVHLDTSTEKVAADNEEIRKSSLLGWLCALSVMSEIWDIRLQSLLTRNVYDLECKIQTAYGYDEDQWPSLAGYEYWIQNYGMWGSPNMTRTFHTKT